MKTLVVIPARYGSSRFPGKPLHSISGKTLVQRVANIAQQVSAASDVTYTVATDHSSIADYCTAHDINVVMTTSSVQNGSERALIAARMFANQPDFVVNLQGDVPFAEPSHVRTLIESALRLSGDVFTPVVQLAWAALDDLRERKKSTPFSGTTCVKSLDGTAYWFSKQIIPTIRDEQAQRKLTELSPIYRHIGLYGYRMPALERFCALGPGTYEQLEGLEQLRFIENGMIVRAVTVSPPRISMSGIDSLEDAQLAERMIETYGDPFKEIV